MNIGVIDIKAKTLQFLQSAFSHLGNFKAVGCSEDDSLQSIAQKAAKGNYDAIAINIECKYEKSRRSALKGVELIYWLRLKENFVGTIITYGFLSSVQILRLKPEYVVLHAKGNYHFCLPNEAHSLNDITLKTNEFEQNSVNSVYTPLVKRTLNLEAIRHKEANWWGIKTLWDCHKVFTEGVFEEEYPVKIKEEMEQLNNYLYTFCFGTSKERLSQILENKRTHIADEIKRLKQNIEKLLTKRNNESSELEETESWIQICEEEINRLNSDYLNHLTDPEQRKPFLKEHKKAKDLLNEHKKAKQEKETSLDEDDKEVLETSKQLEDISLPSKRYSDTKDFFDLKDEAVNLSDPKVLLIDDQAKDGWSEIYEHIIYGRKDKKPFTVLLFKYLNDIKLWLDECEDMNQFDFILLDLRLFPKMDKEIEDSPELISGIEILKYLRSNDCFVPILITSASNKIWSYKIAMQYGADAYWCKEGVDNLFDANASMTNYLQLKQWFTTFMSNEYSCLKEMSSTLQKFKSDSSINFWWKRKDWGISNSVVNKHGQTIELPRHTELKLNEIKQAYLHGTNMYRSYIKSRFDTKEISKGHSSFYLAIVIVQFAKMLELIHNVTEERYESFGSYYAVMKARNDSTGKQLYSIRNDAAHYYTSKNITITIFKDYLLKLNQYLMNG